MCNAQSITNTKGTSKTFRNKRFHNIRDWKQLIVLSTWLAVCYHGDDAQNSFRLTHSKLNPR